MVLETHPEKNNFTLCTGAVVREGRGAPARAPEPTAQPSSVKHMVLDHDFSRSLPTRSNLLFSTAKSSSLYKINRTLNLIILFPIYNKSLYLVSPPPKVVHGRSGSCMSHRSRLGASSCSSTFDDKTDMFSTVFPQRLLLQRWTLHFCAQAQYLRRTRIKNISVCVQA